MPYLKIIISVPLLFLALLGLITTVLSPDVFNVIMTLVFLVPGYLLASRGINDLKTRKTEKIGTAAQQVAATTEDATTGLPTHFVNIESKSDPAIIPQVYNSVPLAYKYENVDIAVIRGKEPDFKKLRVDMPVTFLPEPDNPYDSKAVIVRADNINIGYLRRGIRQEMTLDYLKRGDPIKAFISEIDESTNSIRINMGFYKEKEGAYDRLIRLGVPYKTFKLTGNRNNDMQETIAICSETEEVEYEFDYDKEKYVAICGDEIGYFPKSAEKYLEEEHPAFIEEIEEDENDKYTVKVAVFIESERGES